MIRLNQRKSLCHIYVTRLCCSRSKNVRSTKIVLVLKQQASLTKQYKLLPVLLEHHVSAVFVVILARSSHVSPLLCVPLCFPVL